VGSCREDIKRINPEGSPAFGTLLGGKKEKLTSDHGEKGPSMKRGGRGDSA